MNYKTINTSRFARVFIIVTFTVGTFNIVLWQCIFTRSSSGLNLRESFAYTAQGRRHVSKHQSVPQKSPSDHHDADLGFPDVLLNKSRTKTPRHRVIYDGHEYQKLHGKCGEYTCEYTFNKSRVADAVLWRWWIPKLPEYHPPNQLWIFETAESPAVTPPFAAQTDRFNWSVSYRLDSTVRWPYGEWVEGEKPPVDSPWMKPAPSNRSGVAWVVSNCKAPNGRMDYALALQKHTKVDIYGNCTKTPCGAFTYVWNSNVQCFQSILMPKYKFYLAFENANCRHYITEKFWTHALGHNLVPIVMGAPSSEYRKLAPPGSYIHVDDFETPKHLAEYLQVLETNDTLYQTYFAWKQKGTVKQYNYSSKERHCWLCKAVHLALDRGLVSYYNDYDRWWAEKGVCNNTRITERPWATWKGTVLKEKFVPDNATYSNGVSNLNDIYNVQVTH